ncbi:hypothetical protein GWK47_016602 [Chionoecetes opilio]|uniref:Uncharacterized protein n=1 Tax=Chionoecetes opilio TaxID=41210 RepID=A0A8J5CHP2_CHIOP|nr:hypothetical protein GWK47_016602 [Chionoecetes opilio]
MKMREKGSGSPRILHYPEECTSDTWAGAHCGDDVPPRKRSPGAVGQIKGQGKDRFRTTPWRAPNLSAARLLKRDRRPWKGGSESESSDPWRKGLWTVAAPIERPGDPEPLNPEGPPDWDDEGFWRANHTGGRLWTAPHDEKSPTNTLDPLPKPPGETVWGPERDTR